MAAMASAVFTDTSTSTLTATSGITINSPAGSIVADDPAPAATQAVKQLAAELVRMNLVSA